MPRRAPKPRDRREKEQQEKKKEKQFAKSQFKNKIRKCPKCGNLSLRLTRSEQKVLINCSVCFLGDCLPERAGYGDTDYYQQLRSRFKKAMESYDPNVHCLVLQFSPRFFGLAVDVLKAKYVNDIVTDPESGLPRIDEKNRVVWLFGRKERTDAILEYLNKYSFPPKVLRDSPFRRDFLHYLNGRIYDVSRKEFVEMRRRKWKMRVRIKK